MDIQISIIIVNFNTSGLLHDCLTSLETDMTLPSCEICVVDNDSSDDSLQMLEQHHPDVRVIKNASNAGFAAANNQALRDIRGPFVWLLNPDTIVFPGCTRTLSDFLESHPDVGAVSPRTWLDIDRTLEVCSLKLLTPDRARAVFTKLPDRNRKSLLIDIWNQDARLWTAKTPIPVEGVGGAALFTRKEYLDKLNGLDERFFMGYEDTDLCAALHKLSKRVFLHPGAEIVHLFGQAKQSAHAPPDVDYSWRKAPLEYIRKYFGDAAAGQLRRARFLDRIWRRIIPYRNTGNETVPDRHGVLLEWTGDPVKTYCVEISNDSIFYDKFGQTVTGTSFRIGRNILDRLSGYRWYWRAWEVREGSPENPDAEGYWTWDKQ